jgi:uncharacterized protein YdaU (DUF1376 family)
MLLLMNYWQRGKALDNTGDRLGFVARMTAEEWQANKEILAEFFWVDGDMWSHTRIDSDLEKVREKSEKASEAGKRSANARSTPVQRPLNHKDKDKEEDKDNIQEGFEQFWDIYPRKAGKQEARRAFDRALKVATIEEIISGARTYATDSNRQPQFTAHPTTWLNQGRWSDEPLPTRSPVLRSEPLLPPARIPPRYSEEDTPRGNPMPDSVKALLGRMSDLP